MMILVNQYIRYLLLYLLLLFTSCSDTLTIIDGYTMGTTYTVSIHNSFLSKEKIQNKIDSLLNEINLNFSTYIDESEISSINNATDLDKILLSKRFSLVLNKAIYFCDISNGMYDITIGPLVNLWGFGKDEFNSLPNKNDLNNLLSNTGYNKIFLDGDTLIKKNINVKLDLNSIAKGYAVDEIYVLLENMGYSDFLIEIGGELRSKGNNYYKNWIIGVQNPINGSIIKKIKLNNYSMATSGTYNNFFEYEGQFYSHIINPKSGYPFTYKTVSATILSNNCMVSDAFATLSMTMPVNEVLELINSENNVEGYIILINSEGELIEYKSTGFNEYITF